MNEHTIFKIYKNDANYLEAAILTPKSGAKATIFNGWDTVEEMIAQVKADYGQDAERVPARIFQQEIERRTVHTPEMLELLRKQSEFYERDMTSWHVYGSFLRPMSASWARLGDALFIPSDKQVTNYHTYVVVPEPLEKAIIDKYDLVFVSHP